MHIEEIIFKPAEERIDRQVHRTPRTVQYYTKQVKTLNLDMPLFGLESAVIQPSNLKLKPISTSINHRNNIFNKTKIIQNTLTLNKASELKKENPPLNITSPINDAPFKGITESEYILEMIISKLPESKNTSESNIHLVQNMEGTFEAAIYPTTNSKDVLQSEMSKLRKLESNSETTIDRSNNLIDLVNPRLPKSCCEIPIYVGKEINEDTSNKDLYLSISNKNINKENVYEPNQSQSSSELNCLSKVGKELEDILEETSCSFNNLRESEDVIQFINASKSNMESEDKSNEHITPFLTLSECKQKPEETISLHTKEEEENEIKIWPSTTVTTSEKTLENKISQSTNTSIIDPCPSRTISCSTSSTSGKGRIPIHKLLLPKRAKGEKKVQGNFFPDLYQMQVILKSILVKRRPDPHYWQPTYSSKLKASEPKIFCIPMTYFQTLHELIQNKEGAQS